MRDSSSLSTRSQTGDRVSRRNSIHAEVSMRIKMLDRCALRRGRHSSRCRATYGRLPRSAACRQGAQCEVNCFALRLEPVAPHDRGTGLFVDIDICTSHTPSIHQPETEANADRAHGNNFQLDGDQGIPYLAPMPEPSAPAASTAYRNYVLAILVLLNTVNFIDRRQSRFWRRRSRRSSRLPTR